MAISVHTSNSLKELSKIVSQKIRTSKKGIFEPQYFVTQTEGMNIWIKTQLAQQLGIASNIQFLKPTDLINKIYFELGGKYNKTLNRDSLIWLIYKVLNKDEFKKKYPIISNYFEKDEKIDLYKRYILAEKVADLLDQYQVYRPEMIRKWKKNELYFSQLQEQEIENWQKWIWMEASALVEKNFPDKTLIADFIIEKLRTNNENELEEIKEIHIFGLSIFTQFQVDIFMGLSSKIDVNIYLQNPSPEIYWFDDKNEKQIIAIQKKFKTLDYQASIGNDLLSNWGKTIKDCFKMYFKYDEIINALEPKLIKEEYPDTLLSKIKNQIYQSRNPFENEFSTKDLEDGSIVINNCYTINREIESLYNYLVGIVSEKKEQISAKDIVVLTTDIDAYAPFIKAIFDTAKYKFNYNIVDESYHNGDTIIDAFLSIINFDDEYCKAEEIMQLLDNSFISNRFNINNITLIREAISKAGIRFGKDGKEEDETYIVSWKYGIKKLIFGLAIHGEHIQSYENQEFTTVDIIEGEQREELIKLSHFLEQLFDIFEEKKKKKTIIEWQQFAEKVVNNLIIDIQNNNDEELDLLLASIQKYNTVEEIIDESIPFDLFKKSVNQILSNQKKEKLFISRGITFCSLIPMRSIPFKIVAILGMNFDKFPRKDEQSSLNLMSYDSKIGDRNIKENDKVLFLETILSAEKYLYISYLGQNIKDKTNILPSILVDELINYIETGAENPEMVRKKIINNHPLHSFSTKNIYKNYLEVLAPLPQILFSSKEENQKIISDEIVLDDFINFYKNPYKAYYNKTLNIYYQEENILLKGEENFELNTLEKGIILKTYLEKGKLPKENLPLKNVGKYYLLEIEQKINILIELLKNEFNSDQFEETQFDYKINDKTIKCHFNNKIGNTIVAVNYFKHNENVLIDLYIKFLLSIAAGIAQKAVLIEIEKEKITANELNISREMAEERLIQLIEIYEKGLERLNPFHYKVCKNINPEEIDIFKNKDKILATLEDENEKTKISDPYIIKEYENNLFNDINNIEQIVEMYKILLEPIKQLFPNCIYA